MITVIRTLSGVSARRALHRVSLWLALVLGGTTQLLLPMTATAMALAQARAAAGICSIADASDAREASHANYVELCAVCALASGGWAPPLAGSGIAGAHDVAGIVAARVEYAGASPAWLRPISHAPPVSS